jgi:hypothetical protein
MARKIELKIINGPGPNFNYGEIMEQILRYAPPGKGLTLDEVISACAALSPLEAARKAKAKSVTFTEPQWSTLKEKLATFPFAVAAEEVAAFGLAIRDAPEIT